MESQLPIAFNTHESIWDEWTGLKRLRRRLRAPFYRLSDTGWFGLTPLRTHVLICGYQRAGTTLFLMMMEHAFPRARFFGTEKSAWRAATFEWRNHAVVISKVPTDIFRLQRLRNFYSDRRAKLKTIIMIRDPRDVLSSRHIKTGDHAYFQNIDQWKDIHAHVMQHCNDPDVMVVRYEDLVTDPNTVQAKVEAFTGEQSERRFNDAPAAIRPDFDTHPLNGVRPVDCSRVGRWARSEHRLRMEEILRELPALPQILIDLGYETDTSWTERLRPTPALMPHHSELSVASVRVLSA